jgi:hypothetical protein
MVVLTDIFTEALNMGCGAVYEQILQESSLDT